MHFPRHSKSENVKFIERVRALLDNYDSRCAIGEIGEVHHRSSSWYTTGRRLDIRDVVEETFRVASGGWLAGPSRAPIMSAP